MNANQAESIRQRLDRQGAMLPILAVVMVILFVAAVLSIDIARIHVTRSELRTATDAAARAGVEALGREQSQAAAIDAAKRVANENIVAGTGLTLATDNIIFGTSQQNPDGSFSFNESGTPLNSVKVIGERTADSPDGPVGLLFGPMFGVSDFSPVQSAVATRTDRDIALVLDVSGSMDDYGRFEALQNALSFFLLELDDSPQDERVSLTVYSTFARKRVDLTEDLELIRTKFAEESPGGRTGIGRGMRVGLDSILNDSQSRSFALKSIIVMTDGIWNEGVNPKTVARECAAENVEVHTITFSFGANQSLMSDVADLANGTHLHADTDEQLIEAFQAIARQLQVLLIE